MAWFLHTENPKKELIVLCPAYLDLTEGDFVIFWEIFKCTSEFTTEPAHEIMALFFLRTFILQTRMCCHPVGLHV